MQEFTGFLIIIIFIFIVVYKIKSENNRNFQIIKNNRKSILKKSTLIISKYKEQLARQKRKLTYKDDYGNDNLDNWYKKEIPYFYNTYIYQKLTEIEKANAYMFYDDIICKIDNEINKFKLKPIEYNSAMNGFEFEDFCANLLEAKGWKVDKTKSGADQGVDLIITKLNRKIGVQCKKYSKPISNKSVQEIKAGLLYYNLNEGIVLSNNKYTKSAIELSNTNNIRLFHYLDIDKI